MSNFSNQFFSFLNKKTKTKKQIYIIGFIITLLVTLKEVNNLSYNSFLILSFGSTDFWNNINPYLDWNHLDFKGRFLGKFLYLPLFSILYTPFTLFPSWLGVFLWNIFTYSIFFNSIYFLPKVFNRISKKQMFFYISLLLFSALLSVQYNPLVAAIFLISFSLLEKDKSFWAILLIMISGFTKVYGFFQLIMLLFYPRFWKNALYCLLIGTVLFFAPLVNMPMNDLLPYYQSWIDNMSIHTSNAKIFYSIYRPLYQINSDVESYTSLISLSLIIIISCLAIIKLKRFKTSLLYRSQFLGILMSYSIIFSLGAELNTFVIAMTGYSIWYSSSKTSKLDRILLWVNFVFLVIMPIDIICPVFISKFILGKLCLGIIFFTLTWIIMIYKTCFLQPNYNTKVTSILG